MVGIPLKGQTTTIEHVPNRRAVTENQGGVSSTWATDLEPQGDGTRRLPQRARPPGAFTS